MTIQVPLTPHFEEFVRNQIAAGWFQSEDEVIRAALRLLEQQALARADSIAWLKQEIDRGLSSKPSEPATAPFWAGIRERLRSQSQNRNDA